MTTLKFKELTIEGFQSIGKAHISFNNLGLCYVQGVNNYDTKTKSNGSGKSSIFESIIWCLFDKTSKGISGNVINKFYDGDCIVTFEFLVDDVAYKICRTIKHGHSTSEVALYLNDENISARNKTDTNANIVNILNVEYAIFLQMIILSQNFNNRFVSNTPKAKKELLEEMYGLNEIFEKFTSRISIVKDDINEKYQDTKTKKNQIDSKIINCDKTIELCENRIKSLVLQKQTYVENLKGVDDDVEQQIETAQQEIDDLRDKDKLITTKINKQEIKVNELVVKINNLINARTKIEREIKSLSEVKKCPMCGTILTKQNNDDHIKDHISSLQENINEINASIDEMQIELKSSSELIDKMKDKQRDVGSKLTSNTSKLQMLNKTLKENQEINIVLAKFDGDIDSNNAMITNQKDLKVEYENELKQTNALYDKLEQENNCINHIAKLNSTKFKSFILSDIIKQLNLKLFEISKCLFENEIISISDDTKLDIRIGDKIYEQLSGGEQSKVNIAIIIAQRFLAQQMSSVSCNVLVADEIFDGLDDVSFNIIMNLIYDEMQDVESTFIISHRDITEIPFDNIMKVVKNEKQLSYLE